MEDIQKLLKTIEEMESSHKQQISQLLARNQELVQTNTNLKTELDQHVQKIADLQESERIAKKRKHSYLETNDNDDLMAARRRIHELEKQIQSIEDDIRVAINVDNKGNPAVPLPQYEAVDIKAKRLEEEYKTQLHDISKLTLEKEILQNDCNKQKDLLAEKEKIIDDLKSTLALIESGDENTISLQYAALKHREVKLQESHYRLTTKVKSLKQYIADQNKALEEAKANTSETDNPYRDIAIDSLKSEIQIYETEIKRLKRQVEETRQQSRREQQLMLSAWYDVAGNLAKDFYT